MEQLINVVKMIDKCHICNRFLFGNYYEHGLCEHCYQQKLKINKDKDAELVINLF